MKKIPEKLSEMSPREKAVDAICAALINGGWEVSGCGTRGFPVEYDGKLYLVYVCEWESPETLNILFPEL